MRKTSAPTISILERSKSGALIGEAVLGIDFDLDLKHGDTFTVDDDITSGGFILLLILLLLATTVGEFLNELLDGVVIGVATATAGDLVSFGDKDDDDDDAPVAATVGGLEKFVDEDDAVDTATSGDLLLLL